MGIFDWLFGKKKEWEREKKIKDWKKKEEDRIKRGQYGLESNKNKKKKKGSQNSDWDNSYIQGLPVSGGRSDFGVSEEDRQQILDIKSRLEDKKNLEKVMDKKKFILRGVKQTHIVDDYNSYDYIDSESFEGLLSHFFNMEFESDSGETLFLVCHAYARWENDCMQCVEYEFYNSSGLDSLDYKKIDYNLLNSNHCLELENIIVEEMIEDDQTDVGTSVEGFIGEAFYL
tara:strand:+ start:74 stop:760 length:687 start_codon:yes stop_codon:yes gene_type:complete